MERNTRPLSYAAKAAVPAYAICYIAILAPAQVTYLGRHTNDPSTVDLFGPISREDSWHSIARSPVIDVSYNAGFMTDGEADQYLKAIEQLDFQQESIRVYGRVHKVPRLTASFGEGGAAYEYSGISSEGNPFPPFVARLQDKVQRGTNCLFNFVLINVYRDGYDRVGWHSDDEPALGARVDVASVSLGAPRVFKMRSKSEHRDALSQVLDHGSLLLMRHPTQLHWQHCVPQQRRVKDRRYNLTFRRIVSGG